MDLIGFLVSFIPTFIVFKKQYHLRGLVFVASLVIGILFLVSVLGGGGADMAVWTFISWIVLLFWAILAKDESKKVKGE